MKLIYFEGAPNFGDMLNPLLAHKVFGDVFSDGDDQRFLFIGTVIGRTPPQGTRETILGAGAGYKRGVYSVERREIFCVRGPVTCNLLGISESYAAIDPAILCSRFYAFGRTAPTNCVFVPHYMTHRSAGAFLREACEKLGIRYVSPLDEAESIIEAIGSSKRVVAEALHAAIVAESFDIPWMPVVFSSYVLTAKWRDFAMSIGVEYRPHEIHTNIAYDGKIKALDRAKHALYSTGLGKAKYKYLPVRAADSRTHEDLARRLSSLVSDDGNFVRSTAVKAQSIARLDSAIARFKEKYPQRGRSPGGTGLFDASGGSG